MTLRPCLDCGQLSQRSRCPTHERTQRQASYYQTPHWKRLRARAKTRDANCTICGSTYYLTLHHKQGRREGGADDLANTLWLCGPHHSQYEADKRTGKTTTLTRTVDSFKGGEGPTRTPPGNRA